MAQGLPALCAVIATAILAGLIGLTPGGRLAGRYEREAASAFRAQNYPAAKLCYERLLLTGVDRPDIRYKLALTVDALGDAGRARSLIKNLATSNRTGYAPAHVWQARRLLTEIGRPPPAQQAGDAHLSASAEASSPLQALRAAELHLLRALEERSDVEAEAQVLLSQLYFFAGRPDLADAHLSEAVRLQPGLAAQLDRLRDGKSKGG